MNEDEEEEAGDKNDDEDGGETGKSEDSSNEIEASVCFSFSISMEAANSASRVAWIFRMSSIS